MREIKFRSKTTNGKWYYGSLICYADDLCDIVYLNKDNEAIHVPVRKETIGQFTGLHDKNGKEIYEGDILHVIAEPDDTYDYITQVSQNGLYEVELVGCEYEYTTLAWLSPTYGDCCTIEVIGNIHDNFNLLQL